MSLRSDNAPRPSSPRAAAPRARRLLRILVVLVLLPAASGASHDSEPYLLKTPQRQAWLGIRFRPMRSPEVPFRPARDLPQVTDVLPGTPAREAGLSPGDIIVSLDGEGVTFDDLASRILKIAPGARVNVEVLRRGATVTLHPTLADRRDAAWAPPGEGRSPFGMKLLPAQNADRGLRGLWIESVVPLSPADRAGLRAGMVLVCAQDKPLRELDDLTGALNAAQPVPFATLGIQEGRGVRFVVLPME